jgi:hypothetical protein
LAVFVGADQQVKHLADGPLAAGRILEWQVLLDPVPVAATSLVFDHVAGVDEVGDDVAGVVGNAQQRPGVVGEEAPTSPGLTL